MDHSPVIFGFSATGGMNHHVRCGDDPIDLSFASGQNVVAFLPGWRGISRPSVGHQVASVCVWIDPALLATLMAGADHGIPADLGDVMHGADHPILDPDGRFRLQRR